MEGRPALERACARVQSETQVEKTSSPGSLVEQEFFPGTEEAEITKVRYWLGFKNRFYWGQVRMLPRKEILSNKDKGTLGFKRGW